MQIRLSWIDPNTEEIREPLLDTPVAIGSVFQAMPQQNNSQRISRIVIQDDLITDYHALIDWQNQELIILDQNSHSGIEINGVQLSSASLRDGDRLRIGQCEIMINFTPTPWECDRMVGFLFKRPCGRTDTKDCPYCNDSYDNDYAYYSEYGSYSSGDWGSSYYDERDRYSYDPETGNVNFTEADAISLEQESDAEFEQNMGAS
ncbi:FHA domain-containing protein [Fortiea contorta]|uniref:FHA domain-containing protein n=1 Tax=Fortiea contorta TaxID=1892405 RepID=UPI00034C0AB3|nr:FHA domain-containing protein [Fortiea contorta]